MENLYEALRSIGLSDEYIDFIKLNINDDGIANTIISEIKSDRISDSNSFVEFFNKNFKLIPNLSMLISNNENHTINIPISTNTIANGISAYSKIANAVVETVISESKKIKNISENGIDIVSAKSESNKKFVPHEISVSDNKVSDDNNKVVSDDNDDKLENETSQIQAPLSNAEVTQHTASLWKYQPVDSDEPEMHDEYLLKTLELPYAKIVGASVRGKKHKHDGSNRDDWFEFENIGDITVMAVSDGAGSKKFSRIGAESSCVSAVSSAKKLIEKLKSDGTFEKCIENISAPLSSAEFMSGCGVFADIVQESVISAYNAVQKAYQDRKSKYEYLEILKRDMTVKDFSATLLLAITVPVTAEGKEQQFVISCQIGDGMIAAVSKNQPYNEALKLLGEADGGAFAGETDFLTSETMKRKETLMSRTKIARREISDILIMTDGVADDYYPNATQLARLYTDLELNGIVPVYSENHKNTGSNIINKIPEPVSYPWVNDNSISVPVNYSIKIAEACGIKTEDLWENSEIINSAYKKLKSENMTEEERLKVWLDNYVERGSFDDRTLVIYSVKTGVMK